VSQILHLKSLLALECTVTAGKVGMVLSGGPTALATALNFLVDFPELLQFIIGQRFPPRVREYGSKALMEFLICTSA